ncbi:MAG TPA: hypothetical protein VJO35_02760 [Terriglobales bacterium]|nr:hypothetical protein [Terriglobales bacterium]
MSRTRIIILALSFVVVGLVAQGWIAYSRPSFSSDQILLLLPDDTSSSDPLAMMWLDAAAEEGLHVVTVHDSEFIRPIFRHSLGAGVILPDTIHRRASDMFILALRRYVSDGGKLLLVYDAATLFPNKTYAPRESRLSPMAGISYALYDELGENTIRWSPVKSSESTFISLDVPPGKYYPFHQLSENPLFDSSQSATFNSSLRRYKYGDLDYPCFVTAGTFDGRVLLRSAAGVAAGERRYGRGSVLFVNLPLAYLQTKTDGLMLHGFLKYFAVHVVALPRLLAVPDGIGGMVLNWHVDSNASIKPMQEMESWGLLKQGPYSVHVTAGPDMMVPGDHGGFDVGGNPNGQALLRSYLTKGYSIGSHGGWIHNYFASHVDIDDPKTMQNYLVLNKAALEKISNTAVLEYSAPNGNQPEWVTQWLEQHGFIAYYFTGDSGMGPTREYQSGNHKRHTIWAFPILHLDRAAGFEELSAENHPPEEVEQWLDSVTAFVIANHVARLLYFHPPGILPYHDVVERWVQLTAAARARHEFRWYTMTELAQFLNQRKEIKWRTAEHNGSLTVEASHPHSLAHFAWQLPVEDYGRPTILSGNATVTEADSAWMVVAQSDLKLTFEARELSQ